MSALKPGTKAPAVELPLLGGGSFSLSNSLSKGAVALAFFKVSCPVCQYAFPYFDRISGLLNGKGLTFIGVSQDSGSDTMEFAKQFGVHFPIALDDISRYPVSNAYGLTNVPTLFIVQEDGTISHSIISWSKKEMQELYDGFRDSQNASVKLFPAGENVADFKAG
ncbi:MAG TPA: TlpA disulfide reductase family protein [Terriglobales bacterium]|nr:TlpA disulfide reductase family protein [Terriglobales bacterium]